MTRRTTDKQLADIKAGFVRKHEIDERLQTLATDLTRELSALLSNKETALVSETARVAAATTAAHAAIERAQSELTDLRSDF